ncbi:MAG: ribosome assembly RNA-binding protein YhbY [Pseudomonadota bacterium]
MPLSNTQIRFLRQQAHSLKPTVLTGAAGITEGVIEEIKITLEAHELIKVKVRAEDREDKRQMIERIIKQTEAEHVQTIGHTLTLYKPSKKQKITLPQ